MRQLLQIRAYGELFLVGLFGFEKENSRASFVSSDQSLAIKLEVTFRF